MGGEMLSGDAEPRTTSASDPPPHSIDDAAHVVSRQLLLNGSETAPPERIELRAGPLSARFEAGDLRFVRYGDREIIRRVYVAVRDPNWRTAEMTVSELQVERGESAFRIAYRGRHRLDEIDFDTRVILEGAADGTVTFALDGLARSTFWRGRVGILVLYPAASCAGLPFTAQTPQGTLEQGMFPIEIAAHQPVNDLVALTHEVTPGLLATVRFQGDVFEMEDQRNWTDATYKVYSTPLRLPAPVEVQEGTRISQSVELGLSSTGALPTVTPWPPSLTISVNAEASKSPVPTTTASSAPRLVAHAMVAPPAGTVGEGDGGMRPMLPSIGVALARDAAPLGAREQERLRVLNLAHMRVDLDLAVADYATRLEDARTLAGVLGVPLEVALHLSDDAERELVALAGLTESAKPVVARWLVFHKHEPSTTESTVRLARAYLGPLAPTAVLVAGSNAYFTQLNRGRPPTWALDAICYSVNPQVHAFDDTSVMETLPAHGWTAQSASRFAAGLPLVVSPVMLKPHFNASESRPKAEPALGSRNSTVDARQSSLLAAAWTLGSLKYLAESGVQSVTYYETVGRRGVMESAEGSPPSEHLRSLPGAVFPLYHVLADIGDMAGAHILPCRSSDGERAIGLALRQDGRTRILVANLTPEPRRVQLEGLAEEVNVRRLDETTAARAMHEPEAFRSESKSDMRTNDGALTVELLPYAVARIDA